MYTIEAHCSVIDYESSKRYISFNYLYNVISLQFLPTLSLVMRCNFTIVHCIPYASYIRQILLYKYRKYIVYQGYQLIRQRVFLDFIRYNRIHIRLGIEQLVYYNLKLTLLNMRVFSTIVSLRTGLHEAECFPRLE